MADMTTAEMVERCNDAANAPFAYSGDERTFFRAIAARLEALDRVAKAAAALLTREFDCDDTIETKERKYLLHDVSAALKDAGYGQ